MARRQHRRGAIKLPPVEYRDEDGNAILLRCVLSPATRASYARIATGVRLAPGASREDAWHRAFEFLFERLAVSWSISGAPDITAQRELLARLRVASSDERRWLRERLREHCVEHFPDLAAP
ncbi:MAG: hypothetical protein ABSG64_00585 [Solirubrobacteraceae bacterium]|jgi:hypothetical protein